MVFRNVQTDCLKSASASRDSVAQQSCSRQVPLTSGRITLRILHLVLETARQRAWYRKNIYSVFAKHIFPGYLWAK